MSGAFNKLANFRILNRRVDHHKGSPRDWLKRHEAACKEAILLGNEAVARILPLLFSRVSDDRNLGLAWDAVVRRSGKTPGPDGEAVKKIGKNNKWPYVRSLRDDLREGRYQHGETSMKMIPKRSGNGLRPIRIPNFCDRIVQRALVQVLQPLLDPFFADFSYGYRPKRGRFHAMARAEAFFEEGQTIVVVEDLKDAFEQVPQGRLMQLFKKYVPDAAILNLIGMIVNTPTGKGVRQGGAFSPMCLNLYLHHFLDRVWHQENPGVKLMRVADDLALFCCTMEQAPAAKDRLGRRMQAAGFKLKASDESTIHDVNNGDVVNWLGFEIRWDETDGLVVRVGNAGWARLRQRLQRAMMKPANVREGWVTSVLRGWIAQQGAAWLHEDHQEFLAKINETLAAVGFTRKPKRGLVLERWRSAYRKWTRMRRNFRPVEELI